MIRRVLVTGSHGFIGKNLAWRMRKEAGIEVLEFVRGYSDSDLTELLSIADAVVHLAGENRPVDEHAFIENNIGLTQRLCQAVQGLGIFIPVLFSSSTQAEIDNPYGRSKLAAEHALKQLATEHGNPVAIYRLPGVFGKWCKPSYNSVVATFCYNKANDLPVQINDPDFSLRLVYIDDVVDSFLARLNAGWLHLEYPSIIPEFRITLGQLSEQIDAFRNSRTSLMTERVGRGLSRALYSTYLSYLPIEASSFAVPMHSDSRGVFIEMLKTPDCGQFSCFTAHSGVTRGGHYHHTKTEKFLVIKGVARFKFRNVLTGDTYELDTSDEKAEIVETLPGWTHDITNIGTEEMVVMLWANEVFDRKRPDTFADPL